MAPFNFVLILNIPIFTADLQHHRVGPVNHKLTFYTVQKMKKLHGDPICRDPKITLGRIPDRDALSLRIMAHTHHRFSPQ